MAFKMKGSSFYGKGNQSISPIRRNDVYIDGVLQAAGPSGDEAFEKALSQEKANKNKREYNRRLTTDKQSKQINREEAASKSTTTDAVDAGTIGNKGEKKTTKIRYVDGPRGEDATRRNNLALGRNKSNIKTGTKVDIDQSAVVDDSKSTKKKK